MKKIAVITSTRAELGLLFPVITELRKYENKELIIDLVVTGTHLSKDYGYTIEEIKKLSLRIDKEIIIPVESNDIIDISRNQASTLIKFTELFIENKYKGIVILGDRYEILAIAIVAGNTHTPIFHLCGGDTTEGAIDEWIRHAITKMSYIHFPTNQDSYRRILQMGESPKRVFNFGSTSIDNILNNANMSKCDALASLNMENCKYAICTYHPVTMGNEMIDETIYNFLDAIKKFPDIEFIITKSNADQGGARINQLLDEATNSIDNIHVFTSLGMIRYLSLMKYSEFVLGNSSSGIIEAPVFKVPTVNIGERQKGRLQSESTINCKADCESIETAIKLAISDGFKHRCKNVVSPYGDGHSAEKIANKIIEIVDMNKIDLKKKFYNMEI